MNTYYRSRREKGRGALKNDNEGQGKGSTIIKPFPGERREQPGWPPPNPSCVRFQADI